MSSLIANAEPRFHRTPKGDECLGICRADLIDQMKRGAVLWWTKFGPTLYDLESHVELQPRRDTCLKLIADKSIIRSEDANEVQRQCGMATWRWRQA